MEAALTQDFSERTSRRSKLAYYILCFFEQLGAICVTFTTYTNRIKGSYRKIHVELATDTLLGIFDPVG